MPGCQRPRAAVSACGLGRAGSPQAPKSVRSDVAAAITTSTARRSNCPFPDGRHGDCRPLSCVYAVRILPRPVHNPHHCAKLGVGRRVGRAWRTWRAGAVGRGSARRRARGGVRGAPAASSARSGSVSWSARSGMVSACWGRSAPPAAAVTSSGMGGPASVVVTVVPRHAARTAASAAPGGTVPGTHSRIVRVCPVQVYSQHTCGVPYSTLAVVEAATLRS
jgi:hypothetical protein